MVDPFRSGRGRVVAAFDGGSMTSNIGLLLRRMDQRLFLCDLVRSTDSLSQIARPVINQNTPAVEQVRARIGGLNPVADHMRHGRLDILPQFVMAVQRFALHLRASR